MENMDDRIKSIKLSEIFVGKADGLKEAQEKNFENLFYKDNDIYEELERKKSKFIISGKKGTGKTILAKYFELEQNKKGNPTRLLTDRDVILRQFIENGKVELEDSQREIFIEFEILTELGKLIIENKMKAYHFFNILKWKKISDKIKYIDLIVNKRTDSDNFFNNSYNLVQTKTKKKIIDGKYGRKHEEKSGEIGGSTEDISEQQVSKEFKKNPYYNTVEQLRESIKFVLKYMTVNLIFDDLDEYDDIITGNQKYISFFNGFIKVTNRINSDIYYSEDKCSRVIVIIRSDMLQPLNNSSKNLNKIIADGQIKLNWIKKVPKGKIHPLMELIATKIRNSNELLKDLNNNEVIDRFFTISVRGIPVINYMLNLSFGRPRDIINMLNTIIDQNKNAIRFTSKQFQHTRKEYSELFLNELRNELASHYKSEQIDECFWILQKINKKEFWIDELNDVINAQDLKFYKTAKEFYEFAYDYGIIGNVWIVDQNGNGTQKNKGYSWKYREDGRTIPNENQKFCVHFALASALIHT